MKNASLLFALCVSVVFSPSLFADAYNSQSQPTPLRATNQESLVELQKTAIDLWVFNQTNSWDGGDSFWGRFKWKDNGDNTVSLWPVSGKEFIDPWSLPPETTANASYTVTVRDENYKVTSQATFINRAYLNAIASYLTRQRLRLGKDSIQITYAASSYYVRVEGKVENFNHIDFFKPNKWQIDNYTFTPSEKGLRASYIHQDRINDHLYFIGNGARPLEIDLTDSYNVFVGPFSQSSYENVVTAHILLANQAL